MSGSRSETEIRAVPGQPRLRQALPWLLVYGVALALIAFWPQHVDQGAGFLLNRITRLFPLLTYTRIEFGTNILLFVPLGILLAILLPRGRYLIAPAGFLVSLTIESCQGLFLAGRTASISDLIANTAGVCVGLIAVELAGAIRRRARSRTDEAPRRNVGAI